MVRLHSNRFNLRTNASVRRLGRARHLAAAAREKSRRVREFPRDIGAMPDLRRGTCLRNDYCSRFGRPS
jgi:hypothetical protein